ncbi:MAG: AEC family transporter [Clostridia bacterium]
MNYFFITLISVGIMLAYALPGFAVVKTKLVRPESISAFAVVLMYVCQPCLTIYTLNNANYTPELFGNMALFFAVSLALQLVFMAIMYLLYRRKSADVRYRVATIASVCGNCSFMGVPLLEAIFPSNPDVVTYSIAFLLGMNLLCWTLGSALIARDKKYVSVKKALLNPAVISFALMMPLFLTNTKLPEQLADMFTLLGKMTTPLCMLIMGMRLATVKLKSFVGSPLNYLSIAIKQLIFPLVALAATWFLPLNLEWRQTMFILCCTPVASLVLNFAEMLGEGQEDAANTVLMGTLCSIVTIPVLMLIL